MVKSEARDWIKLLLIFLAVCFFVLGVYWLALKVAWSDKGVSGFETIIDYFGGG